MSFLEDYTRAIKNAREYIINSQFKEIDISHSYLYYEYSNGQVFKLLKVKKRGRFVEFITDYVNIYLENVSSYEVCVIADELKKQLEND